MNEEIASIEPILSVRRGTQAWAFYPSALSAQIPFQLDGDDGTIVAQLAIQGARLRVSEQHGRLMGRTVDAHGHHREIGKPLGS